MKTKQFKHVFFALITLLVLIVSFNGCSDDDDETPIISKTFIELYTGTTWALIDDGEVPVEEGVPTYFRFINDASKVLEGWYENSNEADCYYYFEGINLDNGAMTLEENSENKLIIKIKYTDESETYTCTVQGDTFKIVMVYEEVGWPAETFTIYFNKTSVNVDELLLCEGPL